MRKYIFIGLIAVLFVNCKEATLAQAKNTVTGEKGFDVKPSEVEAVLSFLASDELGGRDTGSEGLEKAAQFIETTFKESGISPYFNTYRDTFDVDSVSTFNVVGYLPGTDKDLANEFIIVGAHFDHIGTAKEVNGDAIANGANDNAAGSSAVITLAKQFAKMKDRKRSLLFILFGAEERGLMGSIHLADVLKKENMNLYAMVNFEMIGVPLNDKPYKAYITGYEMSNMAEKMNEYSGKELIGYLPKAKEFNLFKRSDNYPFYEQFKIPAQTISTFDFTNYQYYHHVDDEASQMNFEFMASLINDCYVVISNMCNSATQEVKLK